MQTCKHAAVQTCRARAVLFGIYSACGVVRLPIQSASAGSCIPTVWPSRCASSRWVRRCATGASRTPREKSHHIVEHRSPQEMLRIRHINWYAYFYFNLWNACQPSSAPSCISSTVTSARHRSGLGIRCSIVSPSQPISATAPHYRRAKERRLPDTDSACHPPCSVGYVACLRYHVQD